MLHAGYAVCVWSVRALGGHHAVLRPFTDSADASRRVRTAIDRFLRLRLHRNVRLLVRLLRDLIHGARHCARRNLIS